MPTKFLIGLELQSTIALWFHVLITASVEPVVWPRWLVMWSIAFAMYGFLKLMTSLEVRSCDAAPWKHAAYLLAWPGMDARCFLGDGAGTIRPKAAEWLAASVKLVFGCVLMWSVAPRAGSVDELLFGWVAMVGLILILHCGLFHLLSCLWRSVGVDAKPLMNSPLLATSVSDFWGRRWNVAFRDLTHRFVFVPLTQRLGPRGSLFIGFLVSGLVHEVAITIPAGSGFGGPTLFFMIQAAAMFIERSPFGRRHGLGRGFIGWTFVAATLVLPVRLLFPNAFVVEVVVPFCRQLGID